VGTWWRDADYKPEVACVRRLDDEFGGPLSQQTTGANQGREVARRPYPKRAEERDKRRLSGSVAASVVLHVVLGAALIRVILIPNPFTSLFGPKEEPVEQERISFLALPQPSVSATASPGRSGGNGRPITPNARPAAPLVAPTSVPSELPPVSTAPAAPVATGDPGTGPLIGRGGPVKGIEPSYSDPRVWVPAAPVASAPKTADGRMDSVVTNNIEFARDSIAANTYSPNKFERGDWTVEKNGRRYGMDQRAIRLGKVSIPTALLALLPLNANLMGNPIAAERDRAMASLRAEILVQSQRALNEEEFRKAVRSLRERKERERQQQEKSRAPKTIASPEAAPTP
jgi:hypothetical protein